MDKSRIGGGLLSASCLIGPWVTDMMGLTVPVPLGWFLLGLCAFGFVAGVLVLFWPKKDDPPADLGDVTPIRTNSTTARVSGGGKVTIADSYSNADVLTDVGDQSEVHVSGSIHGPARIAGRSPLPRTIAAAETESDNPKLHDY